MMKNRVVSYSNEP